MSGGPDVPAPYQSQAEESKLAAADSKIFSIKKLRQI